MKKRLLTHCRQTGGTTEHFVQLTVGGQTKTGRDIITVDRKTVYMSYGVMDLPPETHVEYVRTQAFYMNANPIDFKGSWKDLCELLESPGYRQTAWEIEETSEV